MFFKRLFRKPFGLSNTDNWHERAEMASNLLAIVKPVAVADIGCGDQKLRSYLPSRTAYTGFDLLPTDRDVIRFDLQNDRLPHAYDAVVVLGVLEYLPEIHAPLRMIEQNCNHLVVSYSIQKMPSHHIEKALVTAGFEPTFVVSVMKGKQVMWLCESGKSAK